MLIGFGTHVVESIWIIINTLDPQFCMTACSLKLFILWLSAHV